MNMKMTKSALTLASLSLLAAVGAQAQSADSLLNRGELAGAQTAPSGTAPAHGPRAGQVLSKGNGLIGEAALAPSELVSSRVQTDEANAVAAFWPSYYYVTGNNKVALPSRNTQVCALHKLHGVMETNGMSRVRYFDDNTQELGNLDGNAGFSSSAACVPKSKFFNYSVTPISKIFDTKYYFVENGSTWYNEEWGNAAAMLTGIGGPFRSLNDKAWVWQEPNGVRNVVDLNSDGPGYIIGYSTAFWFNESSGPQKGIKFIGPYGTGAANQAGEYFVGQSTVGTSSVSMAHVDSAFCYLTGVNGELSQANDRVQIFVDSATRRYVLQVQKSNADAIHAYARCMAFDQR